ncbi:MAG: CHAT domain-containing protein [Acidobacteriota bacterium]
MDRLDRLAQETRLPSISRYYLAYYKGLLAGKEEDYRQALSELTRAGTIARQVNLLREAWVADEALALRWTELGRAKEVSEVYERLSKSPAAKDGCERGQLLINWAWATLLAREAGGFPVAGLAEPLPLLDRASKELRAETKCTSSLYYDLHFNRALAELQADRPKLAAEALANASAFDEGTTFFQTLWELDLEARLEIERGASRRALEIYRQLEVQARHAGSPDGQLRAAVGKAKAKAALGDSETALSLLAHAEDLLNRESLQIPLHEGRETFVSQREGVESLEIGLLLESGRNADALAAARRARTRFLIQLASAERVAGLSPSDRNVWSRAINSYQTKRGQADEMARNERFLFASQLGPNRAAQKALVAEGEHDLEQAFALLGDLPQRQTPSPPRPGELLLAFHPIQNGWVAFSSDGKRVASNAFDLTPALLQNPAALSKEVLAPFHDAILRAKRIRILPYGALREIDFHALPFDGDVLLAARPVVYGLDLAAPRRAQSRGAPKRKMALLVDDPNDNLPAARREAEITAQAIGRWKRPWDVVRLTSTGATSEAIWKNLAKADLFHFSGHGTFGGIGGWESGLRVADKGELTVGQLLVVPRSPRWIVLSGCDTARAATDTRIEGFGLANALVLAGAESVIASVRPVVDRTAPSLFGHLYGDWDGESDLAEALQQAQLAWRREMPNVDWQSFRIIEP